MFFTVTCLPKPNDDYDPEYVVDNEEAQKDDYDGDYEEGDNSNAQSGKGEEKEAVIYTTPQVFMVKSGETVMLPCNRSEPGEIK